MKLNRALSLTVMCGVLAACGGAPEAPTPAAEMIDETVPEAPEGWHIAEGPTIYDAESLFEYLDGGAPLYLDFGFEGLTQVRYQMGEDVFAAVTLDIYDMGSRLGAFGLFRSIAPPGAEAEDWGAEGFRSGTIAAAWCGPVYIQGEADDERPQLIEALERLVSSAVASVDCSMEMPAELDVLPRTGLHSGSERYIAADLFGHDFLPGGIVASYEVGGGEAELFFSELGSVAAAEGALARLRTHTQEWGEVGDDIDDLGDGGFRFTDPGLGAGMFVRTGNFVVGIHGGAVDEELVQQLVSRLPRE